MPTPYDELRYPSQVFPQTHPDRLATIATLFGIKPPPVDRCRVLELGCGEAGNLIPMAFTLPGSTFIGIDLASTAIAAGQSLVDEIKLTNIELRHQDLLDFDAASSQFEYIIVHGLYSWVPPPVRERILEICETSLAPNGIAYISYNAYPGGHMRDAVRRMMLFHLRDVTGIQARCESAREFLEFLVEAHADQDVYRFFLQAELQNFLERQGPHFFHDELGEHNHRFYLHEFVRDIARHGLQYISEAQLIAIQAAAIPAAAVQKLRAFSHDDAVAREQYQAFVKLRGFHQSVICRSDVVIERRPDPKRIQHLIVASPAMPAVENPDVTSNDPLAFQYPGGGNMSTNHPLAKAAMLHLGEAWPLGLSFSDLFDSTLRYLSARNVALEGPPEDDADWLADMILKMYVANFVELRTHQPAFVLTVSNRPVASPIARIQLRSGHFATNLRHASVEIDDAPGRLLVSLLDGTRDRARLLADMGEPSNPEKLQKLEDKLQQLANMALFVA